MFKDIKTGVIIHADLDGSVSKRTHRPYDLIHAFLPVLRETAEYVQMLPMFPAYAMENEYSDWWDGNDGWQLAQDLFDVLDLYAPEGYYFGAHIGDGSDFGYWKIDEEESSMYYGSPASQIFY